MTRARPKQKCLDSASEECELCVCVCVFEMCVSREETGKKKKKERGAIV